MKNSFPEFWQERYIKGNIPWDTKNTTSELVNSIDHTFSKKIAILGCGYSRDSVFLSSKGHKVYAIDFAKKPIDYLNSIIIKSGLKTLFPIQEDIFNLKSQYSEFFDIVIEYTCFCAIDPQKRPLYAQVVKDILNKNGQFIALFFPIKKNIENLNDGPPFYVNLEETLSLFENNFNFVKIDDNPNSIKPRKGFEALTIMEKK